MRDLPSLKSLRAFEAAARNGSLTAAADELCIGQGAISHQIRILEEHLGLRVFVRKQHGVELTPEGGLLYASCQRAFDDLEGVVQHIRPRTSGKILRVRVGPFFSMKVIAPRISEFLAANPGVQLHLSHLETMTAGTGPADVIIDYCLQPPAGRFSRRLLRERLVPVYGRVLFQNAEDRLALLSGNRLHYRGLQEWQSWIASSGLALPRSRQDLIFDDQHIILEAVKEGQGVALIDRTMVEHELKSGQICLAHEHFYEPPETYQFVCQEELLRTKPVTKSFLNWLIAEIEERERQLAGSRNSTDEANLRLSHASRSAQ
ncbi:LysR family transcriptional regulator [Ensifer sp. MJa1]|uniref:LysR family transcriptional regulator n=1 Tax=Ensifer sp. MJa1 TaxID=2919888 RepID=UPI00300B8893